MAILSWQDERGTSIVEVMIAIVVFMIIMIGGLNYFLLPQSAIVRQKIKRLAISAAKRRMETLKALQFGQIVSDSNETNTSVSLGTIQGLRTTTVTDVDDAADGQGGSDADSDTVDYKTIYIALSYTAGTAQTVDFTTNVTDISFGGSSPDTSLSSWGRKCELVIQAGQVPGDLTDFPVLLTEATLPSEMFDADGSSPASNGGGDLRFSSDASGSTRLGCQIVTFTTDNNPVNGVAEIWVKVPSVSGSSNTSIWVFYNKPGQSQPAENATYGSESVWDASYLVVQHLSEDPSASSPQAIDATSNDKDGTSYGSMQSNDLVSGKIGKGWDLDGWDDAVYLGDINQIDGATALTVSAWIDLDNLSSDEVFVSKGNFQSNEALLVWRDNVGAISGRTNTFSSLTGNGSSQAKLEGSSGLLNDYNSHFVVMTFLGNNLSGLRTYIDGSEDNGQSPVSTIGVSSLKSSTTPVYFGRANDGSPYFDGQLDEVRISTIVRSSSWITGEYNNQNNPATFVIEGTPQSP